LSPTPIPPRRLTHIPHSDAVPDDQKSTTQKMSDSVSRGADSAKPQEEKSTVQKAKEAVGLS